MFYHQTLFLHLIWDVGNFWIQSTFAWHPSMQSFKRKSKFCGWTSKALAKFYQEAQISQMFDKGYGRNESLWIHQRIGMGGCKSSSAAWRCSTRPACPFENLLLGLNLCPLLRIPKLLCTLPSAMQRDQLWSQLQFYLAALSQLLSLLFLAKRVSKFHGVNWSAKVFLLQWVLQLPSQS